MLNKINKGLLYLSFTPLITSLCGAAPSIPYSVPIEKYVGRWMPVLHKDRHPFSISEDGIFEVVAVNQPVTYKISPPYNGIGKVLYGRADCSFKLRYKIFEIRRTDYERKTSPGYKADWSWLEFFLLGKEVVPFNSVAKSENESDCMAFFTEINQRFALDNESFNRGERSGVFARYYFGDLDVNGFLTSLETVFDRESGGDVQVLVPAWERARDH